MVQNDSSSLKLMQNNTENDVGSSGILQKPGNMLKSSLYLNFDGEVTSMYKNFDLSFPDNSQNIKLGFSLCVGSIIEIYHSIIVRGYNLTNRTETIDTILSELNPSIVCTLYGNSKDELLKIKPNHRILRIVNFKKSLELITLLTKASQEGIIYKGKAIQKLTIITDASYNEIPNDLKNNCLIIEAGNKHSKAKSVKMVPETYAEKLNTNINLKNMCKTAINFMNSLNTQIHVDISTKNTIEIKINQFYAKDTYHHRVILDLIKIITFLNQNKRKSYHFMNKKEEIEEKVYISDVEDVGWCFEIVKDTFIQNSLDLPERYLEMVNYIIGWLTNDPVIKESKTNKYLPEEWDDYFEGMVLISDYLAYLRICEVKKRFLRDERRFREYLLHLSDHKDKGKYKFLHFIQEGKKNKFKLIKSPLIKFFDFMAEYDEFYEEYLEFLQYLKEKKEELSIKLEY